MLLFNFTCFLEDFIEFILPALFFPLTFLIARPIAISFSYPGGPCMHSKRDSSENIVLKMRINIRHTNLLHREKLQEKGKTFPATFTKENVLTARHYEAVIKIDVFTCLAC